ncbi:hypothetical protein PQR14_13950 [Paraburkholderia bryophila]|uniref:DUF6708 domain-containing protein n=1 Tax=Paraburkholderia bryophila TaxID=420952 RepID=UPI0038BD40D9
MDMGDSTSIKAYWGQLFQKRYWREVVIGMPPKDPWAPTGDMLVHQFDKAAAVKIAGQPTALDMVVACKTAYMEVADGRYMRRGFGGMMFTLLEVPFVFLVLMPLYFLIFGNRHDLSDFMMVPIISAILMPLILVIGYQWKLEMLDYTYKPIRLVRSTRKVHVFQHNGPGGVWSLDWDKLQFCLKKGGLNWGVLGYLPDANGRVTHAFYLGAFLPVNPKGIGPDEPLLAHWEYFRRYMEDGPAGIPAPEILLPIHNRREPFLFGMQRSWLTFGPYLILALPFAPVTTLAGVFRWLGMHMSRLPRWPAEVDAQCQAAPRDTTVQSAPMKATHNSVLVAAGTMIMLAVDVVLLWLLFTRVFGIGRIFNQ